VIEPQQFAGATWPKDVAAATMIDATEHDKKILRDMVTPY
jgi:hypothetical protein